jgi:hypothetical protein
MWPSCQLPHLVSDRPPLAAEWRPLAVLRAKRAHWRGRGAVDVFDLVGRRGDVAQAAVDGDVRLGADEAAKRHELVDADVVVFNALPCRVLARRTAITIADAIPPVVAADEVPARPPVDGGVQLAKQCNHVRAEPLDVVSGHQRGGANPEASGSAARDLNPPRVSRDASREHKRCRGEGRGRPWDVDGLAIGCPGSPYQAHANRRRAGVAGEDDPADIAPALDECQTILDEAGWRAGSRQADFRRLSTDKGCLAAHHDVRSIADNRPRRFFRARRVVELAVLEHLRPDAAVDAASEVLDELTVDVLRHRRPRSCRIDRDGGCERLGRQQLEADVVVPGRAPRAAKAAEEAVDLERVVAARVEVEAHLGPVPGAADRRRLQALEVVEVEQRALAGPRLHVLRLDPAAEPIAGERFDDDEDRPGGVAAIL